MTENRIRDWYEHFDGQVYLSFSGGKDSTVLKHIVDSLYDDVPSVFVNTGLEYPEIRQFALKQKNVVRVNPKLKFYDVLQKYGYPVISKEQSQYIHDYRITKSEHVKQVRWYGHTSNGGHRLFGKISECWKYLVNAPFKISDRCCYFLKKEPCKRYEKETGRKPITAQMACESLLRRAQWLKNGCNAFDVKRPMSNPMSFWTEQDVLQYILDKNLPYCSEVYGEIVRDKNGLLRTTKVQRTGCIFCMYGVQNETYPNRFQKLKKTHPKQYEYCMNELGIREVLQYMQIPYE